MQPVETMSESTAGLSLHALRQLLLAADYTKQAVDRGDVTQQVEQRSFNRNWGTTSSSSRSRFIH